MLANILPQGTVIVNKGVSPYIQLTGRDLESRTMVNCDRDGRNRSHAKGTERREPPCRPDRDVGHGGENCHGRNRGQPEIGQGQIGPGWGESARREAERDGTLGDRPQGCECEVGVMIIPRYDLVKSEAKALLAKHGYSEPPIDPVTIARGEGITVNFVTFTGENDGASGFYDPEENAIYVNKHEFPLRQTFTIAHELAHAKLHSDWARSKEYKVFWRDPARNSGDDPHEKEANAFAAHLLVPRSMLDKYYTRAAVADLSRLFAVSVPTIQNRLSFEYGY